MMAVVREVGVLETGPIAASASGSAADVAKGVVAPGGLCLGHPKGLFLIAGVEFWERFSYYGMTGLLVLYLTGNSLNGGLNWEATRAIQFYGFYAGCAFAAPTIGGWISSRYLGERSCILWGGCLVACGHVLLAGPVLGPELLEWLTGIDVYGALHSSGAVLGRFGLGDADAQMLRQALAGAGIGSGPDEFAVVTLGYYLASWSFFIGLLVILIGTGLIKPAVSSIVSCFYPGNAIMREAGFSVFMAAIYLGSVLANFTAGTLGEKVGWHYGFTVTAVGMILGVVVYLAKQEAYLADLGRRVDRPRHSTIPKQVLTETEKKRILALLTMGVGTVVYAAAFYQKGGLLNLLTRQNIDRVVSEFEIPTTWFLAISTIGFVILAPLSVKLWTFLARRGIEVSVDRKLALGLASIAIGYIIIATGISRLDSSSGEKISLLWIVATYISFAIGDVLIWPPQIAAVAALAPERYRSFAIGIWYLTIGLGTWLTGLLGSIAYIFDTVTALGVICLICIAAASVICLLHGRIVRLASGLLG